MTKIIVSNPSGERLELIAAGETYWIKPGDNVMQPRSKGLDGFTLAMLALARYPGKNLAWREEEAEAEEEAQLPEEKVPEEELPEELPEPALAEEPPQPSPEQPSTRARKAPKRKTKKA